MKKKGLKKINTKGRQSLLRNSKFSLNMNRILSSMRSCFLNNYSIAWTPMEKQILQF